MSKDKLTPNVDLDNMELSEEQLDQVAGGKGKSTKKGKTATAKKKAKKKASSAKKKIAAPLAKASAKSGGSHKKSIK